MTQEEIEKQYIDLQSSASIYSTASFRVRFKRKGEVIAQRIFQGWLFGLGLIAAVCTAGVFAVSVSGTFNTFSSSTLLKASEINTNFATLKTAIESIPSQPSMRLIYETDVTSATDTITVSGLNGDVDLNYHISARFINSTGIVCNYYIKLNGDSSASYSSLQVIGSTGGAVNTAWNPSQSNGMLIGETDASGGVLTFFEGDMIAKTNAKRGLLGIESNKIKNTPDITAVTLNSVWNNSSSNITSITFTSPNASTCIGVGSRVEVWARR